MVLATLHAATGITTSQQTQGVYNATVPFFVFVACVVLMLVGYWRMFTKAGQRGWLSIIPIVNTFVMLKIAKKSPWMFLLFLIPLVNIVAWCILASGLSKAFGKGAGTTLGLIFLAPIFVLILGLGAAEYQDGGPPMVGAPPAPTPQFA